MTTGVNQEHHMAVRDRWLAFVFAAALAGCAGNPEDPAPAGQEPHFAERQAAFPSADAAAEALVAVLRGTSDAPLEQVLGPEAGRLIDSGDPVQDRQDVERFLQSYDQGHALAIDEQGVATLLVGPDEWPFPIPIVRDRTEELWRFDGSRGIDELVNRRVGANELSTIEVCRAIVDAQHEYRALDPEGKGGYAQEFLSDDGRRNGLYWATAPGEPLSPLGEQVALASEAGYQRSADGAPIPYHGYFYKVLTAQGPAAPGGAKSYLEGDVLAGGFAVLAWPAEYGESGVMTFLVGRDGIVYESDLGEETAERAAAIDAYDPDDGWSVCQE